MVFGLFTRKSTLGVGDTSASPGPRTNDQDTRLPTPTPSIASVTHRSPLRFSTILRGEPGGSTTNPNFKESDRATDSVTEEGNDLRFPAPPPPVTPSPPPVSPNETKTLYELMLTIPPKTLHAYTIAHLHPQSLPPSTSMSPALGLHPENTPRPPSPSTVNKLINFFSTLAPPPLLHCVRCHKDFYDIENEEKDKACRVPHDDESALVSRTGGGYETLWGCCGQTASGDGSEGPPDGWCYEGRHTTDIRRARFRADSTIHNDKLTSCLKLNCHGIRDQLPRRGSHALPLGNAGTSSARKSHSSPTRSQASASRPARTRPQKSLKEASSSESEPDLRGSAGRIANAKDNERVGLGARAAIDEPNPSSKSQSKPKSRPLSRVRPPPSNSTTASLPNSGSNITPVVFPKARTTAGKPKSTSRISLPQSRTHIASDSETSTRSRPRTRSCVREESRVRDASRSRTHPKSTKTDVLGRMKRTRKAAKPPSRSPTSEDESEAVTDEHQESDEEERGRDRKKRRVRRD